MMTQPPHPGAMAAMTTAESLFRQRLDLIRAHNYPITDGFFDVRPEHELTMLAAAEDMLLTAAHGRAALAAGADVDLDAIGWRILDARCRILAAIDRMTLTEPAGTDAAISPARLMDMVHEHGYPIAGKPTFEGRDAAELRLLGLAMELHLAVKRGDSRAEVTAAHALLTDACAEASGRESA